MNKLIWIAKRAAFIFWCVNVRKMTAAQAAIQWTLRMMELATQQQLVDKNGKPQSMGSYRVVDNSGEQIKRLHRIK